jgi:hypothetical protein
MKAIAIISMLLAVIVFVVLGLIQPWQSNPWPNNQTGLGYGLGMLGAAFFVAIIIVLSRLSGNGHNVS